MKTLKEHYQKFFDSFPKYGVSLAENWEKEILKLTKSYTKKAIKADRENITNHATVNPNWRHIINKDSIINAPQIMLQ